jgi:Flp pilus assembly protein TadB
VSKERARRREERERLAAVAAAERRAAAERQARRDARKQSLTRFLPKSHSRQTGSLAEKKRREMIATVGVLVVLNILMFAVARDWALTALLVVVSVLGAPILYLMLFKRDGR